MREIEETFHNAVQDVEEDVEENVEEDAEEQQRQQERSDTEIDRAEHKDSSVCKNRGSMSTINSGLTYYGRKSYREVVFHCVSCRHNIVRARS